MCERKGNGREKFGEVSEKAVECGLGTRRRLGGNEEAQIGKNAKGEWWKLRYEGILRIARFERCKRL
jgi:hypothetical protein